MRGNACAQSLDAVVTAPREPTRERKPLGKLLTYRGALLHWEPLQG